LIVVHEGGASSWVWLAKSGTFSGSQHFIANSAGQQKNAILKYNDALRDYLKQ
jgi:hypothetical protein